MTGHIHAFSLVIWTHRDRESAGKGLVGQVVEGRGQVKVDEVLLTRRAAIPPRLRRRRRHRRQRTRALYSKF